MLRQTHTFVNLPVSQVVYDEIYNKLLEAGYSDNLITDYITKEKSLDMQGIRIVLEKEELEGKD